VGGKTSGKEEQHGTNRYDVAIIGAGSAGLSALREVRLRTTNCILINDGIAERRARVSAACHRKVLDRDRQDVL
jgi:threonine dehydrogenase-like Zn-dependent dehydrogenase